MPYNSHRCDTRSSRSRLRSPNRASFTPVRRDLLLANPAVLRFPVRDFDPRFIPFRFEQCNFLLVPSLAESRSLRYYRYRGITPRRRCAFARRDPERFSARHGAECNDDREQRYGTCSGKLDCVNSASLSFCFPCLASGTKESPSISGILPCNDYTGRN